MDVAELLGGAELFGHLDQNLLTRLADAAEVLTVERNDRIFDEGDESDELFVVRHGLVAISNRSIDNRESVVALMEDGQLFGEMGLFDGDVRSAEARALERTELIRVPYPPIRAILEERPTLLWEVVRFLSRRLRATDEALADAVFLDVPGRTAKRLLELAGDADEFLLPLTQEELAAMVGASRERVNKAIATFVRLGWITQADRHYRLTDREQLERRSR